jgi:hypothetical protein
MNNMTTNTKRTYKAFPYLAVLSHLLAGKGYDATAKKFGYFEPDKADSTKSFRAHLHRARTAGFKYNDRTVRFPAFTRDGEPLFSKEQAKDPVINGLLNGEIKPIKRGRPAKVAVVTHTKVTEHKTKVLKPVESVKKIESNAGVKLVGLKTRGRKPNLDNSVVMLVDPSGKFLTLSVPKNKSIIPIEDMIKAISPLIPKEDTTTEEKTVAKVVVENATVGTTTPAVVIDTKAIQNKDLALAVSE